ncbi:MAG: hypothetical protein Q9187_002507 [Circinaria calcarea]
MESSEAAEALIPRFELESILNQDQAGRRITLLGTIDSRPALLTFERAAFPSAPEALRLFHSLLTNIANLGANDIYAWYLASVKPSDNAAPDLKLNLIYPCTEAHIKKYSPQLVRVVTETPEIYKQYVRPYIQRKREEGRLNWVFNIIEGRTEQEDVIFRDTQNPGHDEEGFLLLPDMNWDRKTLTSLRLLGLVERRDVWSLRDLNKSHVGWLQRVREKIIDSVVSIYSGVEKDMLKLYIHYQPTYYHLHIHVIHAHLEPNATQAVGKAFGLENLISQLEAMSGDSKAGMSDVSLTYVIGEAHDLWNEVFLPLKEGRKI